VGLERDTVEQKMTTLAFLDGGGEMGERTRQFNWALTSVGMPESWPESLRTLVRFILHAKIPILLCWGTDLILFYNDAFRLSLGSTGKHPTALGQCGEDTWAEAWPVSKPLIIQVLERGEATGGGARLIPVNRNGRIENGFWTFDYSPVWLETGEVAGVLVVCHETIRNLLEVQEEQQRFQFATNAAQLGVWELDLSNNMVHWDERCSQLFGLNGTHTISYDQIGRYIHPDDISQISEMFQRSLDPESGGIYDMAHRTVGADGHLLYWVRFTGRAYFRPDGTAYQYTGVAYDVTAEVDTRRLTEQREANLRSLFEQAPVAISILRGPAFLVELANPAMCAILNCTEAELLDKAVFSVLTQAAGQSFEELLTCVLQTGCDMWAMKYPSPSSAMAQPRSGTLTLYANPSARVMTKLMTLWLWAMM
jgi:PAS domain S-box-containing protein